MPPGDVAEAPSDAAVSLALRLHDRYLHEVVLAYGLCPWAEKVIRDETFRRRVVGGAAPDVGAVLAFIDELAVDIGFVIFPDWERDAPAFERFAEQVRRAQRARGPVTQPAPFLLAAFHPFGADDFADADQMVSFVRRSPDAFLQLVRSTVLAEVRAGYPDLSDAVARQNHATVVGRGVAGLRAILADLRRDREESRRDLAAAR